MSELDRIKEKLAKLISKEESARQLGNLAEAEAFASKIQQMLLEYELSIEEVRNKAKGLEINKENVKLDDLIGSHEGTWVYALYSVAARANFCKVIMPYSYDYNYLTLVGSESGREFTHYLVHQLVSKLRFLSRKSYPEYLEKYIKWKETLLPEQNPKPADKRNTYIRSFLRGAVDGVHGRLLKDREEAQKTMTGVTGLVLLRDQQVSEWVKKNITGLKVARSTSTSSTAGYNNGVAAGKGVGINSGVNGKTSSPKLLN